MASTPESIQVVWHDPTSYQPLRHGPPYLPEGSYEAVNLSVEDRKAIRRKAKTASGLIAPEIPGFQQSPLPSLLAALQAASLLHQMHHWMCKGPTFFADHGLFERLYNESLEGIDQLAEKAVGKGVVLTVGDQVNNIAFYEGLFCKDSHDMVARSLKAEYVCLEMIHLYLGDLKDTKGMTHGLSNLLEGLADKHESFVYLLQQRDATPQIDPYDYDRG